MHKPSRTIEIKNVAPQFRRRFTRALQLLGAGSQSQWLSVQMRRVVREAEIRFGEDFDREFLTAEERFIVEVIADGAAEVQQIASETLIAESRVRVLLNRLISIGWLVERRKGGKTNVARGAVVRLYFLAPGRAISNSTYDSESPRK